MTFAVSWPSWAVALAALSLVAAALWSYYAERTHLGTPRWLAVLGLRALLLLVLLAVWMRPVRVEPGPQPLRAVPVLVDVSASMSLPADEGRMRVAAAWDIVKQRLVPALGPRFQAEVMTFGERTAAGGDAVPDASARESRLDLALGDLRARGRERPVPGVVVVSDGAVPSAASLAAAKSLGVPVFAVPVGPTSGTADREVYGLAVGDARVQGSLVDLSGLVAVRNGSRAPVEVTISENGRPIEVRRVTPAPDGTPVRVSTRIAPPRERPAVYAMAIPEQPGDLTARNDRQSVLSTPAGEPRRVLVIEGAPGFEHSFLKRSLDEDPGVAVDAIVRKGQDQQGAETFYVQAAAERAPQLSTGFPADKAALFQYDAVVLANVAGDLVSRDHLALLQEFVATRGGGLVLLGARSFESRSLVGTPLEDVVPVELVDRAGGLARAAAVSREPFKVALTPDGEEHPIMRLGASVAERRRSWDAAPALAAAASLGDPRPGATLLATTAGPGGVVHPLVAVHRYGRGRAVVFGGEASWRWKMMLPAGNATYDSFWRQVVRWAAAESTGPVAVSATAVGGRIAISGEVRDGSFAPAGDGQVRVRVTDPGGAEHELAAPGGKSAFTLDYAAASSGVHHVEVSAARGATTLGAADAWVLVGGVEPEFVNPTRDDEVLRQLAGATGGRVVDAADVTRIPGWLADLSTSPETMVERELWHSPWVLVLILTVMGTEWALRRRWGLR